MALGSSQLELKKSTIIINNLSKPAIGLVVLGSEDRMYFALGSNFSQLRTLKTNLLLRLRGLPGLLP